MPKINTPKKVAVGTRLEPDLHAWLVARSERKGTSPSVTVRDVLASAAVANPEPPR